MAKLVVCAVFDKAIQAFGRPFYVTHTGGAVRGFTDEVNNSESELSKHPSDFSLYEVGSFDDSNCKFDLLESPRLLLNASDIKQLVN